MSKLKMLKFEAATLQKQGIDLIEQMQRLGAAQLESISDERLVEKNAAQSVSTYEKNTNTVSAAMDVLKEYGADFGMGMFSGRKAVTEGEYVSRSEKCRQTLEDCLEILRLSRCINEANAEIVRATTLIDSLSVWEKLDIAAGSNPSKTCSVYIGTFPREYTAQTLSLEIAGALPEIKEYTLEVYYSSKQITSVCVICHKSVEKEIYAFLRSLDFALLQDASNKCISERVAELSGQLEDLKKAVSEDTEKIKSYIQNADDFRFAYDFFAVKRDGYEALSQVAFSDSTLYLTGYVPEKMTGKLSRIIDKNGGAVLFSEPDEDDDVPVLLSNGAFAQPVESIVEMFAIPSKNDIDPSKIMAFFYYLLFGMMLSDAGYGLVLGLGSFLILRFTSVEGSMRKMLKMFVYCGISTMFWGALFGSWFGDAIPVIRREFFGVENPGGVALWFDPISDPIKLLLFSFGIGICHLFLGLFALGYMRWRDGDKVSAFCDTVPIILTVLGAAPLAAGVIVSVPSAVTNVAKYVAIAGVVLIIVTSVRSGNIFARLFGGLYALYNTASGYLSDILSYSRLLALGLATGSIGSVVNMLAVMIDGPVIKEIVFILVFIVGHTLNMAINVLGAYVHTNRLQFVELFSKFYEGGGRAFNPLKFNTKFFKLKEENKND